MAFRGFDYGKLDNGVSEILNLIQSIEMNLQARINKIEESIEQHLSEGRSLRCASFAPLKMSALK